MSGANYVGSVILGGSSSRQHETKIGASRRTARSRDPHRALSTAGLSIGERCFIQPDDSFWPSIKGGPLAYTFVGHIITETTRRELGVAVNPHLFRDCGVYTVAINAGDRMGIASGLLQHTDQRTDEKHYNKGATIGAVADTSKSLTN